jgi:hypothetical protein
MNQIEQSLLFHKKVEMEDKSIKLANKEIRDLELSQRALRLSNSKIKFLEKEVTRLKNELNSRQNKIFKESFINLSKPKREVKEKETSVRPTANVHQLKRILCLLETEQMCKKDISTACGMNIDQTNSALLFLTTHNLVKLTSNKHGVEVYTK